MKTQLNTPDIDALVHEALSSSLYVYNDNENSFKKIIYAFMLILGHNMTQAEQCALIIHNNGKCCVKRDSYDVLLKIKEVLDAWKIKSEIERT
jgi:ATP-dependent Clp protease adaptor protein ClpS